MQSGKIRVTLWRESQSIIHSFWGEAQAVGGKGALLSCEWCNPMTTPIIMGIDGNEESSGQGGRTRVVFLPGLKLPSSPRDERKASLGKAECLKEELCGSRGGGMDSQGSIVKGGRARREGGSSCFEGKRQFPFHP